VPADLLLDDVPGEALDEDRRLAAPGRGAEQQVAARVEDRARLLVGERRPPGPSSSRSTAALTPPRTGRSSGRRSRRRTRTSPAAARARRRGPGGRGPGEPDRLVEQRGERVGVAAVGGDADQLRVGVVAQDATRAQVGGAERLVQRPDRLEPEQVLRGQGVQGELEPALLEPAAPGGATRPL
jgi:hypothetical protein